MEKQLTVAVLGCGKMGNTIISGIEDMPEVKKIVIYDVVESQMTETKKKHPEVVINPDLDALMADPEIELVFISSNNDTHVPLAAQALRAGKAVMTEKPSGVTMEEIAELERVQKETGGFLQVGLECRYSWAYKTVKDVVASGEIGELKNVHFTYSMPPFSEFIKLQNGDIVPEWRVKEDESGNMYLEKLCHYIDLVRWWNEGSKVDKYVVTSADNTIPYFEIEDNVHVSYHFDNGCVSQLYFIMTAAPGHSNDLMGSEDLFDQDKQGHKLNYVLTGTEGAIEVDIFQREIRIYHHPGKEGVNSETIVRKINWTDDLKKEGFNENLYFHNTYEQNIDIVRRVLAGKGPSITIEDAQESMRLCIEFADAAKNKRWQMIER